MKRMSWTVTVVLALLFPAVSRAEYIFTGEVRGGIASKGPVFFGFTLPLNEFGGIFTVGATRAENFQPGQTYTISRETDPHFYRLAYHLTNGKDEFFSYGFSIGDGGGVWNGQSESQMFKKYSSSLQGPDLRPEYVRSITYTINSAYVIQSPRWTGVSINFTGTIQTGAITAPEPGSLTLLGVGALGLGGYVWRKARRLSPSSS
jgi:hypothetical protein